MPRITRKARRQRREWGQGHFFQLRSGFDYFGTAWGDSCGWPMDSREEWPSVEVLADMAACWEQHRDELLAKRDAQHAMRDASDPQCEPRPLFGELVFDKGMTPDNAMRYKAALFSGRHDANEEATDDD